MNICIVAGARPNFIKVAPILHAASQAKEAGKPVDYLLVYTGKEDDPTLEPSLFADLGINRPDVFLGVDSENLNEITGMVMAEFEKFLNSHPTDVVIVVDDLASTMRPPLSQRSRVSPSPIWPQEPAVLTSTCPKK